MTKNRPRQIRADQWDIISLEDRAFGNCFITIGEGAIRKEVVEFERLPDGIPEHYAKIGIYFDGMKRTLYTIVPAWQVFNVNWLDCFVMYISLDGEA